MPKYLLRIAFVFFSLVIIILLWSFWISYQIDFKALNEPTLIRMNGFKEFNFKVKTKGLHRIGIYVDRTLPGDEVSTLLSEKADITYKLLANGIELKDDSFFFAQTGGSFGADYIIISFCRFYAKPGIQYNLKMQFGNSLPILDEANPKVIVEWEDWEDQSWLSAFLIIFSVIFGILGTIFLLVSILIWLVEKNSNKSDSIDG